MDDNRRCCLCLLDLTCDPWLTHSGYETEEQAARAYDTAAIKCASLYRCVDALRRVLTRAVRWHAEHRVLLNGSSTVVFA